MSIVMTRSPATLAMASAANRANVIPSGDATPSVPWNRATAAKKDTVIVTQRKTRSGLKGQLALRTA